MVDGFMEIRQALGGAGYSSWSGIPTYFDDFSPTVTFEGDNTVMAQQSFSYLLKITKRIMKGNENEDEDEDEDKIHPIFNYLNRIKNLDSYKCKAKTIEDFLDVDVVQEAVEV